LATLVQDKWSSRLKMLLKQRQLALLAVLYKHNLVIT